MENLPPAEEKPRFPSPGLDYRLRRAILFLPVAAIGYFLFYPCIRTGCVMTHATMAQNQTLGVWIALNAYAQDHQGNYPDLAESGQPFASSNEAFQLLIKEGYVSDFHFRLPQSAWSPERTAGSGPLGAGRNGLAYFPGQRPPATGKVSDQGPPWPLISSAWVPGTQAVFSKRQEDLGGTYRKRRIIVFDVNGNGEPRKVNSRYVLPGKGVPNELWPDLASGWLKGVTPLLPIPPADR
jgi:hypothetical protein